MNTFASAMLSSFTMTQQMELLLRVAVAGICGMIVGVERSRRFKDAGVRTHCMVACASAVLMIISKYGFADLEMAGAIFAGTKGADPSRIASQVVTGVSFLGAGIIYKDKKFNTKGLTTAAGIWATAGIGLAVGAGMYPLGLFATVFMLLVQLFTHRFAVGGDRYRSEELVVVTEDDPEAFVLLRAKLEEWGVAVIGSTVTRENGSLVHYELRIRSTRHISQREMAQFVAEHEAIRAMHMGDEI